MVVWEYHPFLADAATRTEKTMAPHASSATRTPHTSPGAAVLAALSVYVIDKSRYFSG